MLDVLASIHEGPIAVTTVLANAPAHSVNPSVEPPKPADERDVDASSHQRLVKRAIDAPLAPRRPSNDLPTVPDTQPANPLLDPPLAKIAGELPDVRREASALVRKEAKERWDADIDPDNTFLTTYDYNNMSGPPYAAHQVQKVSLTDALINNAQDTPSGQGYSVPWDKRGPEVQLKQDIPTVKPGVFNIRDKLAANDPDTKVTHSYTGVYEASPDGKIGPSLDGSTQTPIPPDELKSWIWKTNFAYPYENKLREFWDKRRDEYPQLAKAAVAKEADAAHRSGKLDGAGYDHVLRMLQLPRDSSWAKLTPQDLKNPRQADHSLETGLLNVHGYPSTNIMYSSDKETGKTLLYVPGDDKPIRDYPSLDAMKRSVAADLADPAYREQFSRHFRASDRPSGNYQYGVDDALKGLGAWPGAAWFPKNNNTYYAPTWDPNQYITTTPSTKPFEELAQRTEKHSQDDVDNQITTNADYRTKKAEGVLDRVAIALAPLTFASGPVGEAAGVALGAVGAAQVGLGARDAKKGKTGAADEIANGLMNVVPAFIDAAGNALKAGRGAVERTRLAREEANDVSHPRHGLTPGAAAPGPGDDFPAGRGFRRAPNTSLASDSTGMHRGPGGTPYVELKGRPNDRMEVRRSGDGKYRLVTDQGRADGPVVVPSGSGKTYKTEPFSPSADTPSVPPDPSRYELDPQDMRALSKAGGPEPLSARELQEADAAMHAIDARGGQLLKDAYRDLPGQVRPRPPATSIANNATNEGFVKGMLNNSPGLVVGEYHTRPGAREFLINNMKELKKNAVTTLYMEIPTEEFGKAIKAFNDGRAGAGEPPLPDLATRAGGPGGASFMDVMLAARREGIEIVPTDTYAAKDIAENGYQDGVEKRLFAFNKYATDKIIRTQAGKPGEKFVVLTGAAHVSNNDIGGIHVPGLAETTGARSVDARFGPRKPGSSYRWLFNQTESNTYSGVTAEQRYDATIT